MNHFIAYPAEPKEVSDTYRLCTEHFSSKETLDFCPWQSISSGTLSVPENVQSRIRNCDRFVADTTVLNVNVYFEIGFALALHKSILLLQNRTLSAEHHPSRPLLNSVLADAKVSDYVNYVEVIELIESKTFFVPDPYMVQHSSPTRLLVITPAIRDNIFTRTVNLLGQIGDGLRRYDPSEDGSLTVGRALEIVATTNVLLIFLQQTDRPGRNISNCQAALLAGIATALRKSVYIIGGYFVKSPIDMTSTFYSGGDLSVLPKIVSEIASLVAQLKTYSPDQPLIPTSDRSVLLEFFSELSAENEGDYLNKIFVQNDDYRRILEGSARIVSGRKGTGKSAIFNMIKNYQTHYSKNGILLTLAPNEYQMNYIKEYLVKFSGEGFSEQLLTSEVMWEYIIVVEAVKRLLVSDRNRGLAESIDSKSKSELESIYFNTMDDDRDFSSDLSDVIARVDRYFNERSRLADSGDGPELETIETAAHRFRKETLEPMKRMFSSIIKKHHIDVRLLFDNLDKGFNPTKIDTHDTATIQGLILATRDLEKYCGRLGGVAKSTIFIRDDVYTHILRNTADRGKEFRVTLDWQDEELFKTLVTKRLTQAGLRHKGDFQNLWRAVFCETCEGVDSWTYLFERSMMRPRFLIHIVRSCMNQAFVVRSRSQVLQDDILAGLKQFSHYVVDEMGLELQDVTQFGHDVPKIFASVAAVLTTDQLKSHIEQYDFIETGEEYRDLIDKLLWFGFLGIRKDGREYFIWDARYDLKMFDVYRAGKGALSYCIHRAFWPHLNISPPR